MTEKYKDEYLTLNLILLCVISFTFGIAVGVFTIFSYYLISKNLSTIEFQEQRWNYRGGNVYEFDRNGKQKKLANIFDLGVRENFKQVLGESLLEWILPININYKIANSGFKNGINFKVNEEVYKKWCENAELQNQLNDQLAEYKNRVRREREEYVV
ncbi:PFA3 [Candida pseudojiufengensis]|uniref:PFA3 n=1 Tax=Candida pseudojiufengensis TaxID=497109 RepID=UPI00222541B5|nr:PFA3 [Candida pseudojiufengensis]KAI5961607.1 PFA3 [Candida pseudojiufengensis]